MKKSLIYQIAQSLLLARWKQTLVAAIGVMFSITAFVTLLGFMGGLNKLLDGLVINRSPHIKLFNEIKASKVQPIDKVSDYKSSYNFVSNIKPKQDELKIYNSLPIMDYLSKDSRVMGVAPKLTTSVFYNVGATELTGVIFGVDIKEEDRLFHFSDYVTQGDYEDLATIPNSIILGKALADIMLVNIGDVVQITTSKGELAQLKVVGFFQSGIQDVDKVQSYCSIETTQKLMAVPDNYITDIQIKLHDINMAPEIAKEYSSKFNTEALDIQTANAQFETGSNVRTLISYAVGITLLIVSGFGIYNILNMMIYEKMDSIAILKATGFSGKDVFNVFMTIAISLGIFGGVMGLLFGVLLVFGISNIPFNTEALPMVKTYPVDYNIYYYIIGILFSLITTFFAGYFPARKASKVDPVVIIRGK